MKAQRTIKPNATVMIGTPTYTGEVVADYVRSILHAQMLCASHRIQIALNVADRYSLVQYARNRIAQDFLDQKEFTHLFWIDADLGFDARAIPRMIQSGKDVVGGAYPVKSMPMYFPVELTGHTDRGLQAATVIPTGFLCVSRKAMEAIAETVPTFTHFHEGREIPTKHIFDLILDDNKDGHKVLLGEDVVLCRRLLEAGFELWIDPAIDFVHVGQNRWSANLEARQEQEKHEADRVAALPLRKAVGEALGPH